MELVKGEITQNIHTIVQFASENISKIPPMPCVAALPLVMASKNTFKTKGTTKEETARIQQIMSLATLSPTFGLFEVDDSMLTVNSPKQGKVIKIQSKKKERSDIKLRYNRK